MNLLNLICSLSVLLAPASAPAPTAHEAIAHVAPVAVQDAAVPGRDWILKSGDNICGLKEASQISSPAVVDWQALLDATPEMKKLRDQKIDANSPEGIQLTNDATNRVTQACETIRAQQGHCSIWKTIRHKDGRAVSDVTDLVKAQL